MRTTFTVEDIKNVLAQIFTDAENNENILLINEDTGEQTETDLVSHLNLKFYTWKERLVERQNQGYGNSELSNFDDWVQSLNFSMNEAYALVEKTDEELVTSQDIDSATITARVTAIIQADKIKNFDYYLTKLRNKYIGNPQEFLNAYGNKVKLFILLGALLYEQEPITYQIGECMIVSFNVVLNYLNDAMAYSDLQISLSLTGDDTYDENGNIVGDTHYLTMPLTKVTWQKLFTGNPVPTATRPDITGIVMNTLSNGVTLTYFDFNKQLAQDLDALFWSSSAYRVDGILTTTTSVNIPVFVKVVTGGHSYVYKEVIETMQKVISNNDFTISSITLKGWGKITQ